jgi:hypothetical protein
MADHFVWVPIVDGQETHNPGYTPGPVQHQMKPFSLCFKAMVSAMSSRALKSVANGLPLAR